MCAQGLEGHRRLGAVAGKARRRRTWPRRDEAAPPTLFRVDDAWGHLTTGSHQSATAVVKDSSFDPVFDFFCDFHIFSLKAPKIVK